MFYNDTYIKSLDYDSDKELQNISYYNLNKFFQIETMLSIGCFGAGEEEYFYDKNGKLKKIKIRQFELDGLENCTLYHTFKYSQDGNLDSIIKSTPMYEEIVYTEKKK